MTEAQAAALAAALDVDVFATRICFACLSFVEFALDDDADGKAARRAARKWAPILWNEGLEEPVLVAVRRARLRGVERADEALSDIVARRGRSAIARAVLFRMAEQLAEQSARDLARLGLPRTRLEVVEPFPD